MKLKIASLFPEHLDLNGDQGNMKVAIKRLEWFGHEASLYAVSKGESIPPDTDLIFLGHGSLAAWADLEEHLHLLLAQTKEMIAGGVAFMAVASGYERAIQHGIFTNNLKPVERISKFEIQESEGLEVLGYLNAATDAPVIQKNALLLGTQLHGPFFAKNPEYADMYLSEILSTKLDSASLGEAPIESFMKPTTGSKHNVDRVADIVKAVWELEKDLASE